MDGKSKSFTAHRQAGARAARALARLALLLAMAPAAAAVAAPGDENWSGQFGLAGTDSEILCSTVWNGQLVVGGYFGAAGTVAAPCVALWDGTRWQALGAGLDNGVLALAVWNGELYAGGVFGNSGGTALSGLARWDGAAWQDVGGGVYGAVNALLATPAGLVVGGEFQDTAGASSVNNVALWDGAAWSGFGWGLSGGAVSGLDSHGGQLAAVGAFAGHVALFDGANWNLPGGGLPEGVNPSLALAVKSLNGLLYVGGDFDVTIEGTQLLNIAAWDGSAWQALDGGLDGAVHAFAEWDGLLAIGGMAWNPIFHLGVWDGQWFSYLAGIGGVGWGGGDYVNTLAVGGGRLYVGGVLSQVGDEIYGSNVFAFDGTGYSALGDGGALWGNVRSFGKWNGSLYAGGSFSRSSSSGGLNGIARWNGSRWESLAGGLHDSPWLELRVQRIAEYGGQMVLTGQFDHAYQGAPLHNFARWDGANWSTLGGGFTSETFGCAVYQGNLWVSGGYEELQGHTSGQLWKWTGSAWQAQDGNTTTPFALVVWNGKLIAGGNFTRIAGVAANNVAQWDGTAWSPLGAGFNATVFNLVVSDGQLYAAGEFWLSGGNFVHGLARWDGTQWVPVGGGLTSNWAAYGLAAGGGLWVGGSWDHIGGTTGLQNAARWDGAAWHPLGSGTNGPVFAMYVDGPEVWVGGMFSQAGGQMSWHVGRWTTAASGVPTGDDPARLAFRLPPPVPNPSTGEVSVSFSLPQPASGSLRIYDIRGRLVTTLAQGTLAAGRSALAWDGRAADGTAVASGVYWAVLDADGRRAATRLVRLK
jgi:trimeric autotransporter adhesin